MNKGLVALIVLSRPHFLAGGILLYALGALIAWRDSTLIHWPTYWFGQLVVTSIQLMTHYINEYWDIDTDRLNRNRTFFSGGSGVLANFHTPLSRRTALIAARLALCMGTLIMVTLSHLFQIDAIVWAIFGLAVAGAWLYSSPPLALVRTGFGELAAALVVSFLVPAFAYFLQTGQPNFSLIAASAPLVLLNWAMVTIFEFPDHAADSAVGKFTVLVRLGQQRTQVLIYLAIVSAFGLFALLPPHNLLTILAAPIAFVVISLIGSRTHYGWLTFSALTLYGLTATLQALGIFLNQPDY